MKKNLFIAFIIALATAIVPACSDNHSDEPDPGNQPSTPSDETDPADSPVFEYDIVDYDGEMATDAANDAVGSDADIYWEANSFSDKVTVNFSGTTATVATSNSKILYKIDGAHVTIDMLTNSVKNVEIVVAGKTEAGQLKIYGEKKFKLTLNGVDIKSDIGPAINNQCKKRVFVHLSEGTTNRLADASKYSDEPYYLSGATSADEDRKGCFFSEGNLIFSGTGALVVSGKNKHGIATDGYFFLRPGVTIAVTEAAKNAIHVKGDASDNIGIQINGGLIYATTSSTAGKCLKTDLNVDILGGRLLLNTSGNAEYDADEADTSSAACIKTDGNVTIKDGQLTLKSTGTAGKGMNVDGTLLIEGGEITVATSGKRYVYNAALDLTSSPKGIKADGDITINGGKINISVTGVSDASEGLESKSKIAINDGELFIYAYDDAMNAATDITINGGKIYCYSSSNDGIDSNGTININGGLVIACGSSSPEEGIDCDQSSRLKINGGTVVATAGSAIAPSSASKQRCVVYNGISATKDKHICILNSSSTPIMTFQFQRTLNRTALLFSSPKLTAGTYTVSTGGTISQYTDSWNGWFDGGAWTGGSQVGTFTSSNTITTVGGNSGPGGGPGGGGWGGGW